MFSSAAPPLGLMEEFGSEQLLKDPLHDPCFDSQQALLSDPDTLSLTPPPAPFTPHDLSADAQCPLPLQQFPLHTVPSLEFTLQPSNDFPRAGDTDDDSGPDTASVASQSSFLSLSPNRTDDDDSPSPLHLKTEPENQAQPESVAENPPRPLKRKTPSGRGSVDSTRSDSSTASTGEIPSAASTVPSKLQRSGSGKRSPLVLPLPKPRDQMTPEELAEHKYKQRLLRNRHSAQLSRERKKAYLKDLETEVQSLRAENSELRSRVEDLTRENTRLQEELGRVTVGADSQRLRLIGGRNRNSSNKTSLQNTGLVLFALVFSLGVFCNLTGVPLANSTPPPPALVSHPGRVISAPVAHPAMPALPPPTNYIVDPPAPDSSRASTSSDAVHHTPSEKALTEFISPPAFHHDQHLDTQADDTESDDGESHYPIRDSSTTPGVESHIRLTEQNLKQLLDLLQTMQDSESIFSGAHAPPSDHHYLFSPNGIRFSIPRLRRESGSSSEVSDSIVQKEFGSASGDHGDQSRHPTAPSAPSGSAGVQKELPILKIWVPTHTLKSTLVHDANDDVLYPDLEQTDWRDVEQAVDVSSAEKMLVIPRSVGTKPGINSHRRYFQSGYTEISCTVHSLSEILLSGNGS